ncbi:MAG: hypothetical protein ACLPUT_07225 [Solirubrobacteraceae bacterium]
MNSILRTKLETPAPAIGRDSDLLRVVANSLTERLPSTWQVDMQLSPRLVGWRPDALLEISGPDGERGAMLVEAKLDLEPRAIEPLLTMLERAAVDADLPSESKGPPMVVSRFLSARAQELLIDAGACFADATGNVRVVLERPAVFLQARGAQSNPWRETRNLRTLKGRAAARVVRALCDLRPPFGVRDLAKRAGTALGSTVRALELISREALIVRDERKQVVEVDVAGLVARWAQDFRFGEQNEVLPCLEPRRLESVLDRLPAIEGRYAITGSFAASAVEPYADARLLVLYVEDSEAAQEQLGIRIAGGQSNIWLARSRDDLPLERTWERDGLHYAALSQVACDLFDMPGRSPSEAEELLRYMTANPDACRTD